MRITNPNEVSSSAVNLLVCVRKPGPMAEVAIRKAAPRIAEFFFKSISLFVALLSSLNH
jgi:hypothetical protein